MRGRESFRFMEKLNKLKGKIKAWNKESFGDLRLIKGHLLSKINRLGSKEVGIVDCGRREGDLRNKLEEVIHKEACLLKEKKKKENSEM